MEQILKNGIKESIVRLGLLETIEDDQIIIEIPRDQKNGDYATNIAMKLTKQLKKNPREIAETIIEGFDYKQFGVASIEIAGPGFMNFIMDKAILTKVLLDIISEGDDYGQLSYGEGTKYNVEFVSANPTGELHLGTARGAVLGDCISRLLEKAGFKVTREYYVNDAGSQIHNLALSLQSRYHELYDIQMPIPEDGYFGQDVIEIAKQLNEMVKDKYVNDLSEEAYLFFKNEGVRLELERIDAILKQSRVEFDVWTREQTIVKEGLPEKIIEKLKTNGYTYEQDGALWFRSSDFGDDKDRVLIKSDGSYTYLTPDIAYHLNKFDRGYDYLVDILGADHHGYINRMKAAIEALGYRKEQLEIDIVQVVRLIQNGEELKMSKRTGNAITMREFIDDVGVDAMRYFYAAKAGATHFDFDVDLAKSKSQDNPVYYAQYAHARMCSIEKKAQESGLERIDQTHLLVHPKEIELIKHLNDFPNMILDAAKSRSPHKVTNYIQKIASLFHSFYNECHVIDLEATELSKQRLNVVAATKIVLKNALDLIGVEALEKM